MQFAIQTQVTQRPDCTECLHVDATIINTFQKELFSLFLPLSYVGHVDLVAVMPWWCMPKSQYGNTVRLIIVCVYNFRCNYRLSEREKSWMFLNITVLPTVYVNSVIAVSTSVTVRWLRLPSTPFCLWPTWSVVTSTLNWLRSRLRSEDRSRIRCLWRESWLTRTSAILRCPRFVNVTCRLIRPRCSFVPLLFGFVFGVFCPLKISLRDILPSFDLRVCLMILIFTSKNVYSNQRQSHFRTCF